MKFEDVLRFFGHRDWFDFEMLYLASGEAAECVHTEVYRWRRSGKLIELRRGLFILAEPWRRQPIDGADLAGVIYPPSYLSGRWALGYWGLLPQVPGLAYSSVCARPARTFENAFGTYSYATLPRDLLFGTTVFPGEAVFTQAKVLSQATALLGVPEAQPIELSATSSSLEELLRRASSSRIALPEKALLDLCFMEGGEWDSARLAELGLEIDTQNLALSADTFGVVLATSTASISRINLERFKAMAERSGRPRLIKAAKALSKLAADSGSGRAEMKMHEAATPELPWNEENQ
jgi:hypothetical protein